MLLQQIAKWCDADVIVYVGCGERGNELADVLARAAARSTDPRTGEALLERTVLVANTSNMPVLAREASIHTGVTVAEYFRDMGYDVVADRRLHLALGRGAARGRLAHRRAARRGGLSGRPRLGARRLLRARAAVYGRSAGAEGSVTILGAVSPPGGDMTEPVTAHTRRVRPLLSGRSTATSPTRATTRR